MRRTGENNEALNARIETIVTQLGTLGFEPCLRPSVTFSLITGPACTACNGLKLQTLSLEEMLDEVRKKVLFDGEINDRRMKKWTKVAFEALCKVTDCEEKAKRNCIKLVTEDQKDLIRRIFFGT